MSKEPVKLKHGDPCPSCGGELRAAAVPSDEQRRKAEDREKREPLPPHMDSASAEQRQELGALYRCRDCQYQTRFPLEHEPQADAGAEPAAAGASGHSGAARALGAR